LPDSAQQQPGVVTGSLLWYTEAAAAFHQERPMSGTQRIPIGGILKSPGLSAIRVMGIPDRPGVASRIFRALGRAGINVELIAHSVDERGCSHITFCVERARVEETLTLLETYRQEVGFFEIKALREVALVSVFGAHFRERHGIAGAFFYALAEAGINILDISTSVSTCTCLISQFELDGAVRALEKVFQVPG